MARVFNSFEQYLDNAGNPVSGGTLVIWKNRTTTKVVVHSNPGLTIVQSNPYPLDASGRVTGDLFFTGTVSVQVNDSDGAQIRIENDIASSSLTNTFDSIASAFAADLADFDSVDTIGFTAGWAATVAGPQGGAEYHDDGTTGTASTIYSGNDGFFDSTGKGFALSKKQDVNDFMFGVLANGSTDDLPNLQFSCNWATANSITLNWLDGDRLLNGTLQLPNDTPTTNSFNTIKIIGAGGENLSKTILTHHSSQLKNPLIAIAGARNVHLEGFRIQGNNAMPGLAVASDSTCPVLSGWLSNNIQISQFGPYAAIAIDPMAHSSSDYDFSSDFSRATSSKITLERLYIRNWGVGLAVKPANNDQGTEDIVLSDSHIVECAYGITTGSTQQRNVLADRVNISRTFCVTDNLTFGKQNGQPVRFNDCNTSKNNRLMQISNGIGEAYWRGGHCENNQEIGLIGPSASGSFTTARFDNIAFSLTGIPASALVTGVTLGASTVITMSAGHGFTNGDQVQLTGIVGTTELNGHSGAISSVTATAFTYSGFDSSLFTTYVSGGVSWRTTVATTNNKDAMIIANMPVSFTSCSVQSNNVLNIIAGAAQTVDFDNCTFRCEDGSSGSTIEAERFRILTPLANEANVRLKNCYQRVYSGETKALDDVMRVTSQPTRSLIGNNTQELQILNLGRRYHLEPPNLQEEVAISTVVYVDANTVTFTETTSTPDILVAGDLLYWRVNKSILPGASAATVTAAGLQVISNTTGSIVCRIIAEADTTYSPSTVDIYVEKFVNNTEKTGTVTHGSATISSISSDATTFFQAGDWIRFSHEGVSPDSARISSVTSTTIVLRETLSLPGSSGTAVTSVFNTRLRQLGVEEKVQTVELASTDFLDRQHDINSTDKFEGKQAFDKTVNKVLFANSGSSTSTWKDSAGVVVHTPS